MGKSCFGIAVKSYSALLKGSWQPFGRGCNVTGRSPTAVKSSLGLLWALHGSAATALSGELDLNSDSQLLRNSSVERAGLKQL